MGIVLSLTFLGCSSPAATPTVTTTVSQTASATPSASRSTSTPGRTASPVASVTREPAITPTGLPTGEPPAAGSHVAAGSWSVISYDDTPSSQTTAAQTSPTTPDSAPRNYPRAVVRINGLWRTEAGGMADRTYTQRPEATSTIDTSAATGWFLSWSYVVTSGDPATAPAGLVMPSTTGTLFSVQSVLNDHDCPDYLPTPEAELGVEVRRCAIYLSSDGGSPVGLAFTVPGASHQYWYLDLPAAQPHTAG